MKQARGIALVCALWCIHTTARADPPALHSEPSLFRYRTPQRADYLRAGLEGFGILGLELANYFKDHELNSRDWEFRYNWEDLRKKLGRGGYSFDTNSFDTNFITHPLGGMLYYWAARSNRLGVFESLLFATVTSAVWEYFGEMRERASLNDLVATPLAGIVFGETTIQLGLLFDRSCDSAPNRVLGSVFGPFKSLHDLLDGAQLAREVACDRYGLSRLGQYEFHLALRAGAVVTSGMFASEIALHTRVVALGTYGRSGRGFSTFADGNISELWLNGGWAGFRWNDFSLRAALIPFGLHYRSLAADGGGLHGFELTFGLLLASEYSVHRFMVSSAPERDRYFALDAPGVSLEVRGWFGATRLELQLQTSLALAGLDTFALRPYVAQASADTLTSIARANQYNYAVGFRLGPRMRLVGRWFEVGAALSVIRLELITGRDRHSQQQSIVQGEEQRSWAEAWFSAGPRGWPLRFTLSATLLHRAGRLGLSSKGHSELRWLGGLEAFL